MIDPKVGDYIMFGIDFAPHYRVAVVLGSATAVYDGHIKVRYVHTKGVIAESSLRIEARDRFATDTEILEAKLRYGL